MFVYQTRLPPEAFAASQWWCAAHTHTHTHTRTHAPHAHTHTQAQHTNTPCTLCGHILSLALSLDLFILVCVCVFLWACHGFVLDHVAAVYAHNQPDIRPNRIFMPRRHGGHCSRAGGDGQDGLLALTATCSSGLDTRREFWWICFTA